MDSCSRHTQAAVKLRIWIVVFFSFVVNGGGSTLHPLAYSGVSAPYELLLQYEYGRGWAMSLKNTEFIWSKVCDRYHFESPDDNGDRTVKYLIIFDMEENVRDDVVLSKISCNPQVGGKRGTRCSKGREPIPRTEAHTVHSPSGVYNFLTQRKIDDR